MWPKRTYYYRWRLSFYSIYLNVYDFFYISYSKSDFYLVSRNVHTFFSAVVYIYILSSKVIYYTVTTIIRGRRIHRCRSNAYIWVTLTRGLVSLVSTGGQFINFYLNFPNLEDFTPNFDCNDFTLTPWVFIANNNFLPSREIL